MVFYALHIPGIEDERVRLLAEACSSLKISFKEVDPFSYDLAKNSPVQPGDMVYRVSRGKILQTFEKFFLTPGVVTFYTDPWHHGGDPFVFEKEGIACPKTIFCPTNNRERLISYVEALGGFPIVIKALGGTRGLGVMKIDSFSTLFGIVDYLLSQCKLITLCQYIPVKTSARFIVLGDKVIASLEYRAKGHDFRSNEASTPIVIGKKYPAALERLAVHATKVLGLEFSGVDILIHEAKPYVTEVNFPCNFVRPQTVLDMDIARAMIEYLSGKGYN